ncbi:MAG: phosphoribosylanthranilate isomerase [Endomicrobiales bacterium]|nr:phosphoribosylanthranilate isomerase [Endomicrobiales bacterium]
MVKVKICGVTVVDDAVLVASLGADYVGLNFVKESQRKISVKMAKEMTAKMPSFIQTVGVFADEAIEELAKTAKKTGLKMVQLHGSETPEYCRQAKELTGLPVIKSFRISDEASIEPVAGYADSVDYFLLDAYVEGEPGGTGQTFNWDLALKVKDLNKQIFLAGGLNPDNVKEAIEKVMPFAVDVASGVERLPRRKDFDKMNKFIRTARGL